MLFKKNSVISKFPIIIFCRRISKSSTTHHASHSDRFRSEASKVEEAAKSGIHGESKQSRVRGRSGGGKAKTFCKKATGETRSPAPKPGDSSGSGGRGGKLAKPVRQRKLIQQRDSVGGPHGNGEATATV